MNVLGGSAQVVYDASNDDNFRKLGGSAVPCYIVGSGEIDGGIVPPYIPMPDGAIAVSGTDWLIVSGVDYLRFE